MRRQEHIRRIPKLFILLLALALISSMQCERNRRTEKKSPIYGRLRSDILDLYFDMHPLQASRLGHRRSDSLLFTYSDEELELSLSRLRRLDAELMNLSVSHLEERSIEDSHMMLRWLKGNTYALDELRSYTYNPLLYCWIVEEALWCIPLRADPPYEGESSAYERRISRIPQLLGNASSHIVNPPRPYVKLASQRIRRLLETIPALKTALAARYGEPIVLPETVTRSMTGFLGFLEGTLSSQTRGNIILGSENLSKILLYDDGIKLDPASTIEEAEQRIRRIVSERVNAGRAPSGAGGTRRPVYETDRPALLQTALDAVGECDRRNDLGGNGTAGPLEVRYVGTMGLLGSVPKSADLTIPPIEHVPVSLISTSLFSTSPCSQVLLVDDARSGIELLFDALWALSERRPRSMLCERADTVRAVFGSALYPHLVRCLEIEDLIDSVPEEKGALTEILAREQIRALARTVVVLELHAGTLTTDSATEYLMRKTGLSREHAAEDVAMASYSPSIAYPGIALLTADRMMKYAASTRESAPADERVRRLLLEKYYLPLPSILESIPRE
jgi:hypothetical protein